MKRPVTLLSVAGSDSSGGAGIQADMRTVAALGGHGLSAVTAVTAQNSTGIHDIHQVPPAFVAAQMEAVLSDMGADAVKIGMLGTAETIDAVADVLAQHRPANVVIDPVLLSSSGRRLLEKGAERTLVSRLFPLSTLVTPNLDEAAVLSGRGVSSPDEMLETARALAELGAPAILITGGHLENEAKDLLWEGGLSTFFEAPRIPVIHTHGTGCVLSTATAFFLAGGDTLRGAVGKAKTFITRSIETAYPLGRGVGTVNPLEGALRTGRGKGKGSHG